MAGQQDVGCDKIPSAMPNSPVTVEEDRRRGFVIQEILSSEASYLQRLQLTLDLYVTPLRNSSILELREVNTQFLNWDLFVGLHKDLYDNMVKDNSAGVLDIGQRFKTFSHVLKCYSQYLTNFDRAREERARLLTGNRKFSSFVDKAQSNPASMNLPLESFLMEPVQRVPRYRLLLEQLLKHTPEAHPEHASLCEALQLTAEVAQANSDAILERENRDKVMAVMMQLNPATRINLMDDPARQLLKDASLHRQCRRGIKEFHFWLFTDRLLYGDKLSVMVGPTRFKLNRDVSLYECRVRSFVEAAGSGRSEGSSSILDANCSIDSGSVSSKSSQFRYSSADNEDEEENEEEEDDNLALAANILGLDLDPEFSAGRKSSMNKSFGKSSHSSLRTVTTIEDPFPDTHAFVVQSPQKSFMAWAPSEEEKNSWIETINAAIDSLRHKAVEGGRVAPLWTPDTSVSHCQHCGTKFGAAVWRHHCRSCGALTCDSCSKHRISLPQINSTNKERVCNRCFLSLSAKKADAEKADAEEEAEGERKLKLGCELCGKTFSLLLRKHYCHVCYKFCCHGCSGRKLILPHLDTERPHRVCDLCVDQFKIEK
jgi:hypothetical protein